MLQYVNAVQTHTNCAPVGVHEDVQHQPSSVTGLVFILELRN